jgi:hypothetical protein
LNIEAWPNSRLKDVPSGYIRTQFLGANMVWLYQIFGVVGWLSRLHQILPFYLWKLDDNDILTAGGLVWLALT